MSNQNHLYHLFKLIIKVPFRYLSFTCITCFKCLSTFFISTVKLCITLNLKLILAYLLNIYIILIILCYTFTLHCLIYKYYKKSYNLIYNCIY